MAQATPLALSNIVDVTVTVEASSATANSFNQGLFIGPSTVIPSYGSNPRLRQYAGVTEMLSDGFTTDDPEYIAAEIYFSQSPAPSYIWIGRQDATAISTLVPDGRVVTDGAITAADDVLSSATANFVSGDVGASVRVAGAGAAGADLATTIASVTDSTHAVLVDPAGTTVTGAATGLGFVGHGYAVGNTVSVTQTGASNGVATISAVTSGMVTALAVTIGNQGTAYSTANGLATTAVTGSGTGLEVNITAVGESLLQAAEACRAADDTWYGLAVNAPTDSDNLALAGWADAMWQTTRYYPWSADAGIPAGTVGNIALQMQTLQYRSLGIYSTTQGGLYPNNIYAAAGLMGVEMGLNTGLAGSFFTSSHKSIVGIATEPLTQSQYTAIKNAGFNAYCNFNPYSMFEPGRLSNGAPSFLWLYLAMLVANLQINELNVLAAQPAVAQTNADEQLLLNAAEQAGSLMNGIGFLADGTWEGKSVAVTGVSMQNGQAVPGGYSCQAQPYAQQSTADRDAGKAMPIYMFITTAGAVQSLVIGVYAQI